MKILIGLFTICLVFSSVARAEIRELKNIADLQALMDPTKQTLWAFDNDNTLTYSKQLLGTDQWFRYTLNLNSKLMPFNDALNLTLDVWNKIQQKTAVLPVELTTGAIVRAIQSSANSSVMLLTARPPEMAETTIAQLKTPGIDIDFGRRPPACANQTKLTNGSLYDRGYLFTAGGQDKGPTLVQLLQNMQRQNGGTSLFKRVIFIDDRLNNVQSVDASLTAMGIEVLSLHYTKTDGMVQAFDPNLSNIEMNVFMQTGALLTDEKAKDIETWDTTLNMLK